MSGFDWAIVVVPVALLIGVAIYSRRYARDVVDFLAAGRIAGRYVLSVGDMTAALSVITLVAGAEQYYQTGFAVSFWAAVTAPFGIFMSLTGYCLYRWRETRCLSMGQFLELRYGSKFFRVFCAVLRSLAEMVTNAIGPAIATNFFIYYLGLPHQINIWGINLPCYLIIVVLCLSLALVFIWPSGRISLLITDCFQGLLSYPIFVIIVGYIILEFSWFDDITPVMTNHVPGQSFMNPYDISQLRDFNIFALIVTLLSSVLNRAVWIGNDTSGAGKTAHEQKMAGILGAWRNGMSFIMILLLAVMVITFMNSSHFSVKTARFKVTNTEVRQDLSRQIIDGVVSDPALKQEINQSIQQIGDNYTKEQWAKPISQQDNHDTPYFKVVREKLGDTPEGRYQFQKYRSLYNQQMMPTLLSKIFPIGMLGLFCLLMIMLLISTDDSRIFNASSTLVQDVILPLFKGRLDKDKHLLLLRLSSVGVAIFFLIVSLFFSQLDYINMFTTIMCAVWAGGAGPIMVFGLYSRFGNIYGAWAAIILGSGTSLAGLIAQRTWAYGIYPWLEKMELVEAVDHFLKTVSAPFNPWIAWSMDPVKFPINSFEIFFISMVLAVGGYIVASYLTYKPYNLDKLLHRGQYADDNSATVPIKKQNIFQRLIGIDPEYTMGDKVIAYLVFGYSIVFQLGIAFVLVIIWNLISPWPKEWWNVNFLITILIIPGIIGIISTVWFLIGGIHDARQLFIDLNKRTADVNDNGQVLTEETSSAK